MNCYFFAVTTLNFQPLITTLQAILVIVTFPLYCQR
uniref:Uncharacterized protein n=1 Tax=Tetranychus urticae TaxID=32264 RepID=T1L4V8_TETUR